MTKARKNTWLIYVGKKSYIVYSHRHFGNAASAAIHLAIRKGDIKRQPPIVDCEWKGVGGEILKSKS